MQSNVTQSSMSQPKHLARHSYRHGGCASAFIAFNYQTLIANVFCAGTAGTVIKVYPHLVFYVPTLPQPSCSSVSLVDFFTFV